MGGGDEFQKKNKLLGLSDIFPISLHSLEPSYFMLVSGNLNELRLISTQTSNPAYFLLNSPWRRRTEPHTVGNISWRCPLAQDFGAQVEYRILLSLRGLDLNWSGTKIRRTI